MKRRTFLQLGLAAMTAARLPLFTIAEAQTQQRMLAPGTTSPRRVELLDDDWRFSIEEPLFATIPVVGWVYVIGTPDQEAQMIAPNVDTSTWTAMPPGASTLPENAYGWYRTMLPDIKGPGRVVRFECVDDNGTVYVNGIKLTTHEGWESPFEVNIDSAWKDGGPNQITVLVQNLGGGGGITALVTAGTLGPKSEAYISDFDDSSWRTVHLPHDYVVEGAFVAGEEVNHGSLPKKASWYRRRLNIPAADQGKTIWLQFDGVYRNSTVFVNGKQLFFMADGYDPFQVDITNAVNYGQENVIAVHVDPRNDEGWFYEGGGIYRHVWLNVAHPVHVIPWGVYVTSEVQNVLSAPSATLTIQTDLTNAAETDRVIDVKSEIIAADGTVVAMVVSRGFVSGNGDLRIVQTTALPVVQLWSLESRNMYTATVTISSHNQVIDKFTQPFGVRTIRFDKDQGFFLNEKPVKLRGTCNHQDFCGVGVGMPDSILWWRVQKLKERLNCNAIRCSHNPMTPSMYDACDALGVVVMDETRHPGDAPVPKAGPQEPYSHTEHIETMIRRDRNHPSIIMWSMANEESELQGSAYGAAMLSALMDAVHKHDTTRPVTTAKNHMDDSGWLTGFATVEDIIGVNYYYERYDWLHTHYPNKMVYGSEIASDLFCRGVYKTDDTAMHLSSYHSPEGSWQPAAMRDFVAGGFVWTGFDYRGEPTPYGYPEISSNFGLLDLCGFPKDAAFYYKAWWKPEEPSLYIFPHWNWAGQEGQNISVWSYSNCDQVELFLNNVSQGKKEMPKLSHLEWSVPYSAGTLYAVGYTAGAATANYTVQTTDVPAGIRLAADRTMLKPDGEDTIPIAVEIVDSKGLVVPTASNLITFTVNGAAANAGVGNGDPSSQELNQADSRSAFAGLAMVLVKAGQKPGNAVLTATADGLTSAILDFKVG